MDNQNMNSNMKLENCINIISDWFESQSISQSVDDFLRLSDYSTKWVLYSDYCLDDKNKPNNVITFVLIPFISIEKSEEIKNTIQQTQPKDIKHAKDINQAFIDYIKTQAIFSFSFIVNDRKLIFGSNNEERVQSILKLLEQFRHQFETWMTNASPEEPIDYYESSIKIINRVSEKISAQKNVKLISDILLISALGAISTSFILKKLDRVDIFGWFPDRDKSNDALDNIIVPLFEVMRYNHMGDRYTQFYSIKPGSEDIPFYDNENRIADIICGTLADYNLDTNGISKDKFGTVLRNLIANNPFIKVFKIKPQINPIVVSEIKISNNPFLETHNISTIKGFRDFLNGSQLVLKQTLANLFSADINLLYRPIQEIKAKYDIDILENIKRPIYILSNDMVLLLSHIIDDEDNNYIIAYTIQGQCIGQYNSRKIFDYVSRSVSNALQEAYGAHFTKALILLNENLVYRIMSKYLSAGAYNSYKVNFIIEQFNKIRTTTFEGKYFSTGLIVSKSLFDYKKSSSEENNLGSIFGLYRKVDIYDDIDTRFWYLADGHTNFYLTDLKKEIHYMYIYKESVPIDVNRVFLSKAIKGHDFLLRTECGRELSVVTSEGIEFIYQENTWRYRDYRWLQKLIANKISISDEVYDAIIYFILYCSKNDISSIIWLPNQLEDIDTYVSTKHALSKSNTSIIDSSNYGLIKRILSSDGATIIDKNGNLKYYGCIARLEDSKSKKPKGTGETAASKLAANGIAIKISQDGIIKVFLDTKTKICF